MDKEALAKAAGAALASGALGRNLLCFCPIACCSQQLAVLLCFCCCVVLFWRPLVLHLPQQGLLVKLVMFLCYCCVAVISCFRCFVVLDCF